MPAALAGTKLRKKTKPIRGGFSAFVALVDVLAIFLSAAIAAAIHNVAYGELGNRINLHLWTCFLVSALFIAINALRDDYAIARYLNAENQLRRSLVPWCTAFAIALVIASLAAPATNHRLLPTAGLFVIGLAGVGLARQCLTHGVRARAAEGHVIARRIFLLGFESELDAFAKTWEPHRFGMHIVAASVLCGPASLEEDLALARAYARILAPDDVFVLVPWSDKATIEAAINAFLGIPAAIHLGPEKVLDRFSDARIAKIGPITCLNLVDHPLSPSGPLHKASVRPRLCLARARYSCAAVSARRRGDQARQSRADHLPPAPLWLQPEAVSHLQISLDDHMRGQFEACPGHDADRRAE